MIFLTVGSQMPFDRLVRAVDDWASAHPEVDVLAQIGETDFVPKAMRWVNVMAPEIYLEHVDACDFLIGHAGMGTVITAAERGKPLLVMPRRGHLRETRNDHQVATARWLAERPGLIVAMDEDEISTRLAAMLAQGEHEKASDSATNQLVAAVRAFIEN